MWHRVLLGDARSEPFILFCQVLRDIKKKRKSDYGENLGTNSFADFPFEMAHTAKLGHCLQILNAFLSNIIVGQSSVSRGSVRL